MKKNHEDARREAERLVLQRPSLDAPYGSHGHTHASAVISALAPSANWWSGSDMNVAEEALAALGKDLHILLSAINADDGLLRETIGEAVWRLSERASAAADLTRRLRMANEAPTAPRTEEPRPDESDRIKTGMVEIVDDAREALEEMAGAFDRVFGGDADIDDVILLEQRRFARGHARVLRELRRALRAVKTKSDGKEAAE